jgi:hypothetical protein
MIMAAAAGVLAVLFVIGDDYEKAFIAAAGGAVCWLLNYRTQLREKLSSENEAVEEDEEADEEVRP